MTNPRKPNVVDIHVGTRLRVRRCQIKMSQSNLAEKLGVTFQQVQKYENGSNRIGASRLWKISRVIGVPITYFFEGVDDANRIHEDGVRDLVIDFLGSRDGYKFADAFNAIEEPEVRRQLLAMARLLADNDTEIDTLS